jgi:predicted metal-dependent hydrolase
MADGRLQGQPQTARVPKVRRFPWPTQPMRRWWYGGNPYATHRCNALNLLFPAGEAFFVRSVRHYLPRIEDPVLRERVRAFIGQEAQHGRAHDASFVAIEGAGIDLSTIRRRYERLAFGVIEPIAPPALRLSVTVALEHLTAAFATHALSTPGLDQIDEPMLSLLRWHAAEEIEHKSVAFDVLREVAPSYPLRVGGMVLATVLLGLFWEVMTRSMLAQDDQIDRAQLAEARRAYFAMLSQYDWWGECFAPYLRPDFHPDQQANDQLAVDWLAANGFAAA